MGIVRRRAPVRARLILQMLLAPIVVVAILTTTSQAASAAQKQTVNGSVSCAFSGVVHFAPPLRTSGGGTNSHVSGKLSSCTFDSTTVKKITSASLRGSFSSSPFSCSSSSQTGAALSATIHWVGEALPISKMKPTEIAAGMASGSFAGGVELQLQVPSTLHSACARKGLRSAPVSGTISLGASTDAATCSLSGTVAFTPPLTGSGGGAESSIEASLSTCTTNSGVVEGFGTPQLTGTFASRPFTCSSSSPTNAALSAVINWKGSTVWPSGSIPTTTVDGSIATGWFSGAAVVTLQVPSDIAAGCAGGPVSSDSVSGTVTIGPACGMVGKTLSVYPLVPPICGAQDYLPTSMTTGPDGALWFTTYMAGLIGRRTTSGTTTFFPAPIGASGTWGDGGIVTGPDGALWFIADDGGAIGRMTTSGSTTTFPVPSGSATALTSGPDGALWFTDVGAPTDNGDNAIGRITTTGDITMFTDPKLGNANWASNTHRFLWGITDGPNGNLWFSMEYASNETKLTYIGTMTPSGAVTTYSIPFKADPTVLTTGPDGAIWFGNDGEDVIGRVTTLGKFSEYTGPGEVGQVLSITAGPDGALWFTNYTVPGDSGFEPIPPIGRITTAGKITTYGSSIDEVGTVSITAGSDGAMWFIDHLNDSIGRVSVP